MRVTQKTTRDAHNLQASFIAQQPDRLRVDVTSALDTVVFVMVMNEKEVRFLVPREKKYYITQQGERALRPILNVPLDPRALLSFLFDQFPADKMWKCVVAASGLPQSCRHLRHKIQVQWKSRDGERRKLLVSSDQVEIEMSLGDFQAKVENPDKIFDLKIPPRYQVIDEETADSVSF